VEGVLIESYMIVILSKNELHLQKFRVVNEDHDVKDILSIPKYGENANQPAQSPSHSLPPLPQLPLQSPSTPPHWNV
jgi:hypothetical protein